MSSEPTNPAPHKVRYPARYRMLAYCAGKEAHAFGTPRHANPYTDSEERRKWWDGWDVSLAQSLVINGDRRKTGDRLTV